MKFYATFYKSTAKGYIHPLGDRSIIIIDGRLSWPNAEFTAGKWCHKRGFDAFTLQRADNLRDINTDDNPLIALKSAIH